MELGGGAAMAAAAMALLALLLLPKAERRRLKLPVAFLALFAIAAGVHHVTPREHIAHQAFGFIGLTFLLLSLARSTFLFLYFGVVIRSVRRAPPRILRDLTQALFMLGALTVVLRAMGVRIESLLGASALLTAVVGFALQDTLGNVFAGLAIQMQAPFEVGDFIRFDTDDNHVGCVVEMNWRAVKVITIDRVELTVPNATLAKSPLHNFSKPSKVARRSVRIAAPAEMRPEVVHRLLEEAIGSVRGVLKTPRPMVLTDGFDERGVVYRLIYFVTDFATRDVIASHVRDRVWYALQRAGAPVQVPRRTVHVHEVNRETLARQEASRVAERREALTHVDFLAALPEAAQIRLAESARMLLFAPGEPIIRQGESGDQLFIIQSGTVSVKVASRSRGEVEVATLGPDQFFGEMSLMTGEERRASVYATDETATLVIDRDAIKPILDDQPRLAAEISDVLAARAMELGRESAEDLKDAEDCELSTSRILLGRIRDFFSLGS